MSRNSRKIIIRLPMIAGAIAVAEDEWKDLGNEARKKRQAALKTLRQQRAELSEWYGGMKHSSGDAWDEVKAGFVDAYEALGKAFSDATKAF